jgi:ketosteroid isomerase-like protein
MTVLAALLAALALAQGEPEPPAAPAERERPAAPAPDDAAAPPPPAATGHDEAETPAAAPVRRAPRAAANATPSEPERTQVAKAALAFLDALVAGDADGLAALSSERFSFDGDVRSGRDAIRAGWRGVLAGRAAKGALLDLEIVPGADAVARLGPPPARLAPLAGRGGWVGIADVSGRAVIVFLVREGGRWVVAGLHD